MAGEVRRYRTDVAIDSVQRAMVYADGVTTVLPPAPDGDTSTATDLNDAGLVVGGPAERGVHVVRASGHGFLYDRTTGRMTDLGTVSGYESSVALAVNNAGQVVGFSYQPQNTADVIRRAFLFDARTGTMTDLNQLIPPGSGWVLLDAFDINDAGQIVGRGLQGGAMHAFVLTPAEAAGTP